MILFDKTEFLERVERTKHRMENAGLEVLFVVDPANINYLTGYNAQSYYVDQAVVIDLNADEPLWMGRRMDIYNGPHTSWLSPDSMVGYPEDLVQSRIKHPMKFMADLMKDRGYGDKTIGVELEAPHFTPKAWEVLKANLPDAKLQDARMLVSWVRSVKSEAEIALMRKAGKVADKVIEAAVSTIKPGLREADLAAAVLYAQAHGTDEFGGDYSALTPLFAAGKKASAPHLTWTDEEFEKESSVNLELCGVVSRYHCPISRTVYLGKKPTQKLLDTAKHTIDALNAELAAIKPGVTCEEVDKAWRDSIAKSGANIKKESRTGYSIGVAYPPDWGEHTFCLRPGDRTIIEPNMAFHVISGIWMDEIGFEISQSVVVNEKGCEFLSKYPRELIYVN